MNSKRQIDMEIEGLIGLKNLVEVYQEVAAGRMQKVRGAVLQSRMFTDGLVKVFGKVRAAYKRLKDKPKPVRRLNGRTVAVLVSANSGLYGDIVDRTYQQFENFVKTQKPDVVVLGKQGMRLMADLMPEVLFNYFDFPDEVIDAESFDMVMRYLIQFERIVVFHGQFQSILQQRPVETLVSGQSLDMRVGDDADAASYLFEPSVEAIAKIFEGEIMASIFEQALYESMLSKQASRMLSLDRSLSKIDERLARVYLAERQVWHRTKNKKQQSTISGFSLWGQGV